MKRRRTSSVHCNNGEVGVMGGIDLINQWAESWMAFMGCRILDSVLVFAFAGLIWLLIRRRAAAAALAIACSYWYCLNRLSRRRYLCPVCFRIFSSISASMKMLESKGAFGWTFGEMNTGDAAPSTCVGCKQSRGGVIQSIHEDSHRRDHYCCSGR